MGGKPKKCKNRPGPDGRCALALIRVTSRAEVDVIGAQLCSCFHVHLKILSQAELETEGSRLVQSLVCLPPLVPPKVEFFSSGWPQKYFANCNALLEGGLCSARPYESCKNRAGPPEMPHWNWYHSATKKFHPTIIVGWK